MKTLLVMKTDRSAKEDPSRGEGRPLTRQLYPFGGSHVPGRDQLCPFGGERPLGGGGLRPDWELPGLGKRFFDMATPKSELLPVLPMDDVVVLPHMTVTLAVEGDDQKAAIEAARQGSRLILLVPRIEGKFGTIGTVGRLGESAELPTGAEAFMIRGEYRARLGGGQADIGGALFVQADPIADPEPPTAGSLELAREYRALLENLVESRGVPQVVQFLRAAKTPGHLADLAGYSPDLTTDQKLEVLETVDLEERLSKLIAWMKQILADASLKEKIRSDVAEGMEKTQREFLLRQQMEAIKKQLNEGGSDVVATYRERVVKAGMPEAVLVEVERELGRLERTSEQNPEYGWIRTYLDWMLDIHGTCAPMTTTTSAK